MNFWKNSKPTMRDPVTGEIVRHRGASTRCAFWQGYDGNTPGWVNPRGQTFGDKAWRDGRAWRKLDEKAGCVMPENPGFNPANP